MYSTCGIICTVHVVYMYSECGIYVQYMWYICTVHVVYMYSTCGIYVQYMWYVCTVHVCIKLSTQFVSIIRFRLILRGVSFPISFLNVFEFNCES